MKEPPGMMEVFYLHLGMVTCLLTFIEIYQTEPLKKSAFTECTLYPNTVFKKVFKNYFLVCAASLDALNRSLQTLSNCQMPRLTHTLCCPSAGSGKHTDPLTQLCQRPPRL